MFAAEDNGSSDSEYYSALEDCVPDSDDDEEEEEEEEEEDEDEEEDLSWNDYDDDDVDEEDLLFIFLNNAVVTKRSGKKKKEKWRRQEKRKELMHNTLHIADVPFKEAVIPEIAIASESVDSHVDKPVLSLQEICVRTLRRFPTTPGTVPPKIQGMLGKLSCFHYHNTLRIRAMCHILDSAEKCKKYDPAGYGFQYRVISEMHSIVGGIRNVWGIGVRNPYDYGYNIQEIPVGTGTLPATHRIVLGNPDRDYHYNPATHIDQSEIFTGRNIKTYFGVH